MTDSFSKSIYYSLAAHVALVLMFTVRAVLFPSEPIVIRHAIRVDMVGLPDKAQPAPVAKPVAPKVPTPAKVEKPKPVVKPKAKPKAPKVNLKKAENTQKSALEKIAAMEALSKIKNELAEKKQREKIAEMVRGNNIAKGNALTGIDQLDYDRYFDDVKSRVHDQWNIPQWMADAKFKASALVKIDERGYVVSSRITTSSGNATFDARVLEAIKNASPLPVPPTRLRGVLSSQGIIFNFPDK